MFQFKISEQLEGRIDGCRCAREAHYHIYRKGKKDAVALVFLPSAVPDYGADLYGNEHRTVIDYTEQRANELLAKYNEEKESQ